MVIETFFFVSITLLPYRLPESLCFFLVMVGYRNFFFVSITLLPPSPA